MRQPCSAPGTDGGAAPEVAGRSPTGPMRVIERSVVENVGGAPVSVNGFAAAICPRRPARSVLRRLRAGGAASGRVKGADRKLKYSVATIGAVLAIEGSAHGIVFTHPHVDCAGYRIHEGGIDDAKAAGRREQAAVFVQDTGGSIGVQVTAGVSDQDRRRAAGIQYRAGQRVRAYGDWEGGGRGRGRPLEYARELVEASTVIADVYGVIAIVDERRRVGIVVQERERSHAWRDAISIVGSRYNGRDRERRARSGLQQDQLRGSGGAGCVVRLHEGELAAISRK